MGGAWWREHGVVLAKDSTAGDAEREAAERHIVEEYARRVCEPTGYEPVIAPLWRYDWKRGRPFFYLVLFTAHPQGIWYYADALADAIEARQSFVVLDHTLQLLEGALGDGGRKEVAAAVRDLADRQEIVVDGPTTASEIYKARLSRGSVSSLFS